MREKISIVQGDITKLKIDAIVNAANTSLSGGGGVDGAIHRAAGPELLEACRKIGGCPTGEARVTKGYNLPVRRIIHTVGPVWKGGGSGEEELLAKCYRSCFELCQEYQMRAIAFPSISTGAYGFPIEKASRIAINEAKRMFESGETDIERVMFVCFSKDDYETYLKSLDEIFA
jgi:O-acetyl-ADP-ribose deacetylase (regulator of RNase III)